MGVVPEHDPQDPPQPSPPHCFPRQEGVHVAIFGDVLLLQHKHLFFLTGVETGMQTLCNK